jgi:hypothetical protein
MRGGFRLCKRRGEHGAISTLDGVEGLGRTASLYNCIWGRSFTCIRLITLHRWLWPYLLDSLYITNDARNSDVFH